MSLDPGAHALSSLLSILDNNLKPGPVITSVATIDLLRKLLSRDDYISVAEKLRRVSDVMNLLEFALYVLRHRYLSSSDATINFNRRARRLMFKIISKTPVVPRPFIVTGVSMPDKRDYIGRGGYGNVFKGELCGAGVALKVLYKNDANNLAFCREALMWGSLEHNFVLPFLGIHEEEGGMTFLVSPYMKNGTLAQWRTNTNPLIAQITERMLEVAQGMEYIHSEGVVHGDLRGENVLLDADLHIQIADFGLTRLSDATNTQSGAKHLNFAAPELFGCPDDADDPSAEDPSRTQMTDVYAFGCIYYEIHYDRIPFAGRPEIQIVTLVSRGKRPPRQDNPSLSEGAWELIQHCWATEPLKRPGMKDIAEQMMGISQCVSPPTSARSDGRCCRTDCPCQRPVLRFPKKIPMPYRYSPVARSHQWLWMNRPRKERNAKVKIYMLIHRPNHISRKTKMQNRRYHDPGNLNAMRSTRKAPLMSLQPALSPCFQVMRQRCGILSCAWNPKNHPTLASGSRDAVVNFWTLPDPSSSTVPSTSDPFPPVSLHHFSIKAGSADLTSLNWSPSGQLLAIGSYDSILRISKPNGELYFTDSQHNGPIFATRFSKSGHWLLTASLDGTTCLWNVSEKRLQRQYHCHTDGCLNVAWLDDWTFASCGADSQIYIIQVDGGESIKTLSGHENEINEIRCNSTGTRLASCSDDTTARVWNIENISSSADSIPGFMASDVIVLRGHSHAITTICWCPDHPPGTNQLIATSSFDGTARIWDSVTGECLKVLADHERPIFSMTFSPNGKWLATGSGDGWLHIYSVESRLKRWSWHAGANKPGVFEIDWQEHEGISRLAVALECRQVAVIDALAIPALRVGHRTLRKRKRS